MFCLLAGAFGSFQARAETLEDAVRAAVFEHPSVESAKSDVDIAGQVRREEYSGYFPEVSISGSTGRIYGDNATSRGLSVTRGAGYSNLGEGNISVRQMIYDGLETPARVNAAENRLSSADLTIADLRENLALRAVQAYVNVVRARKGKAMLDDYQKTVADYLARISDMVDDGAADESELQQARDISVILEGIRTDFAGQVMAAEAQYEEITGKKPDAVMTEPAPMINILPKNQLQALETAKAEHPSIEAARLKAKAASYDIKAEQGTLYPDVDGELSYLKSDKRDIIGGELEDGRALVRMNWNFSTGGEQLARIKRMRFTHEQARHRQAELERQIERGVKVAFTELQTSAEQLKLLHERTALNEKLFSAYQSQFEAARVNLLQLMQSNNQVFNTKLETVNGQYRNISAQYAVLASLGKLQQTLNLSVASASGGQANGEN